MTDLSPRLRAGGRFPEVDLPDHTGRRRTLTEIAAVTRWCWSSRAAGGVRRSSEYLRELTGLQDEFEVAYTRIVVVSVDPPQVQSAFRAGLGARFSFLSDAERRWIGPLGLQETTDTTHDPYLPTGFTLFPDLTIHAAYHGYWYWGRATMQELRQDMRAISRAVRSDFDGP